MLSWIGESFAPAREGFMESVDYDKGSCVGGGEWTCSTAVANVSVVSNSFEVSTKRKRSAVQRRLSSASDGGL